ncbi:MAG: hypothetical protein AAFV80_06820 [Bacteroidota bacterium]
MSDLKTIQDLLAEGEMEDALNLLEQFLDTHRPDLKQDWINLNNRFSNLERELRRDTISYEESARVRARILDGINMLIELADRSSPQNPEPLNVADKIILEGLETAQKNLAEKLSTLLSAHSTSAEGTKKFELQKAIETTEKELADIQSRIDAIQNKS